MSTQPAAPRDEPPAIDFPSPNIRRRHAVQSSRIAAIGYDPVTSVLEVQFPPTKAGRVAVWRYWPVEPVAFAALVNAVSIGQAFDGCVARSTTIHAVRVEEPDLSIGPPPPKGPPPAATSTNVQPGQPVAPSQPAASGLPFAMVSLVGERLTVDFPSALYAGMGVATQGAIANIVAAHGLDLRGTVPGDGGGIRRGKDGATESDRYRLELELANYVAVRRG